MEYEQGMVQSASDELASQTKYDANRCRILALGVLRLPLEEEETRDTLGQKRGRLLDERFTQIKYSSEGAGTFIKSMRRRTIGLGGAQGDLPRRE